MRDPRGGFTTTALLRLSPVVPFALVAYAGSELAAFDPDAGPASVIKIALAIAATVVLFLWIGFAAGVAAEARRAGELNCERRWRAE